MPPRRGHQNAYSFYLKKAYHQCAESFPEMHHYDLMRLLGRHWRKYIKTNPNLLHYWQEWAVRYNLLMMDHLADQKLQRPKIDSLDEEDEEMPVGSIPQAKKIKKDHKVKEKKWIKKEIKEQVAQEISKLDFFVLVQEELSSTINGWLEKIQEHTIRDAVIETKKAVIEEVTEKIEEYLADTFKSSEAKSDDSVDEMLEEFEEEENPPNSGSQTLAKEEVDDLFKELEELNPSSEIDETSLVDDLKNHEVDLTIVEYDHRDKLYQMKFLSFETIAEIKEKIRRTLKIHFDWEIILVQDRRRKNHELVTSLNPDRKVYIIIGNDEFHDIKDVVDF